MTTLRTVGPGQPNANNARARADVLTAWVPDGTIFGKMFGQTKGQATAHYSSSTLLTAIGPEGYYVTTTVTTDNVQCRNYYVSGSNVRIAHTVVTRFTLASSLAAAVDVFSGASNNLVCIAINPNGSIYVLDQDSQGSSSFTSAPSIISMGATHTLAITFLSPTGGESHNVVVWLDGKQVHTTTLSIYSDVSSRWDCAPRRYGTPIHGPSTAMVYMTAQVSGVGAGQSLSQDPWQLFKPAALPIFIGTRSLQESFADLSGVTATSSVGGITAVGVQTNGNTTLVGVSSTSAIGAVTAQVAGATALVVLTPPNNIQPQGAVKLNLANPIARKIRYCSTLGNNVLDLKTNKFGTVIGAAPVVPTRVGMARGFTATSSQGITLPTTNMVSGYPLTVACWVKTTATAAGQVIYSFNGTGYSAILGWINSSTTNGVMPNVACDPAIGPNSRALNPNIGLAYLVAVHRNGTWDLYVNGVSAAVFNSGSAWAEPAAGNHSIGYRLGGASLRYHDGTVSDLCVFEGELSVAEIKSLSGNPQQIYAPIKQYIFPGLQESFATYSGVSATSSIGVITAVGDGVNGSTALTGIQLSSVVGSLTAQASATTSIIGQQATSGRTAPTATTSATTTITGISVTSSIGALTAQGSAIASLGGVSATSSVGILGVTTSAATTLSGVNSTSTVGIIGASANGSGSTTLVGVNSTSSVGTVTATGVRNATTTLTGVLSTSSVGSLNVSVSVGTTLGGVGSTSSVGVVTGTGVRNASTTLIGQSATSNRGIITAYSSAVVTLNGVVVNTAVGSLNISAGASTTLPSVLATVSVGNVNADGNFPYTISLRYYYSEERNSVFTPESKNNVFISDSRTVETTPSPERNNVFVPDSKNNVFAPDSRDVQTIPSPSRNQVFVSSTRTMVFISPKRDT